MTRINLSKIRLLISKNKELFLLILLFVFSITSTQIYNLNKKQINKNFYKLINNTYFQKNLKHIFDGLEPRYEITEHIVKQGETLDKILKKYQLPENEIKKIKKYLIKEGNINSLKTGQKIKFTIDKLNKTRVVKFIFPISRTKKIELSRDLSLDIFT